MATTVAELTTAPQDLSVWPRYPSIYEINTWVWLSEMSQECGKTISLFSVPSAEWDAIAALGFDAVNCALAAFPTLSQKVQDKTRKVDSYGDQQIKATKVLSLR